MLWLFQRGTTHHIVLSPGQYLPNTAQYCAASSGEREGNQFCSVCSSNENTEDVFCKVVVLHMENDVDEAIWMQNLLQNKLSIKPGIIFADMPCGKHVLENLSDAVNGSAWHNYNSVIPVRLLNNPLLWEKTLFALQKIFQESTYRQQQGIRLDTNACRQF
uniref:Uncharacterized protein n=1 Tax=Calidris pygmaea TaxID=425635 RepID=A0A8C3PLZ0_9CHAR